jgi:hypothetical protein
MRTTRWATVVVDLAPWAKEFPRVEVEMDLATFPLP